ncbi:hypothetical protein A5746_00950 [Mycolicibacterium conceptionense]|uniref:3'-5' exoribonuclease domain-containing protein n=1 Tax=Mycolicibacterium conceptionense TaxID=451644 RepID=UPI00096D9B7D|nr:3'-5' exoribonuclease [Mycolicibacterium conceptionense]OMB98742.1 hypothetical protein A5746_00950 [Mycolicibacterium conceptionense]
MSPRNICYDTEFLEDGLTIELISIGITSDDRRDYYAVNADVDFKRVRENDWLWANVVPHLPTTKQNWDDPNAGRAVTELDTKSALVKPKWVIANEVRDFITAPIAEGDSPRLWAYYGAYDHVALAQLFGPMIVLPEGIPMWTHELMQLLESVPADFRKPIQTSEHDALADARWNMRLLQKLLEATAP